MADDVTLPGVGTTVATDDIGGNRQAQIIKVAAGQNGSALPVDATDMGSGHGALWVDPRYRQKKIQVTPVITTVAYTAGDAFGPVQQLVGAARAAGGSGYINSVTVLDRSAAQRPILDLVFFDVAPAQAVVDNAVYTPTDADMLNCIGVVAAPAYNTPWIGTPNSVATLLSVGIPFVSVSGDLWVQAVVRTTPTMAVGDVTLSYTIAQD
jgi:hypothetical protein